jgi:peptidase A4-like protein
MRKVFVSGALALIGLAAPAASVLAPAAAASAAAPRHAAASTTTAGRPVPGLYHVPIIGKVTLPGVLGSLLGGGNGAGLRRATAVSSSNWSGYADTNDTFGSVSSSWTEPTVNCADSNSGLDGVLSLSDLLGGPGAASAFWVGLDGYNSTSVEQLGTDSDCDSGTPSYYAWYEMYPNPSEVLPSQYPVQPGDQLTALVASNAAGTSFTLEIKDTTAGWTFSTTQTGSGFARSSAEVIAEAPSSCSVLFCSEIPLADFGQVNYSGSSVINTAGTKGSLSAFDANEITMSDNGTTLATPSSLSSDGSSFSLKWDNS